MKKKRIIIAAALLLALGWGMSACGGGSGKGGATAEADGEQTEQTAGEEQTAEGSEAQSEQKAQEQKKWWEQDFQMTYKQYVMGQSMTRIYARKGNVLASKMDGSQAVNLFVFTDSTRTDYLVNPDKGLYGKKSEKQGLAGMEESIKAFLKGQLGDPVFKDILKPDGDGCTAKDTTIFGRPAYVITQELTKKVMTVETFARIIEWVDKENGLPYYKYGFGKSDDKVITDGKVFEITAFSAEPTYEGLVMSLEGLTEISK